MSVKMREDDPAYWMLTSGHKSTPVPGIFRPNCYICRDPEFAQMGLPLCYKCPQCGGHIPADDTVCSDCGVDDYETYLAASQ